MVNDKSAAKNESLEVNTGFEDIIPGFDYSFVDNRPISSNKSHILCLDLTDWCLRYSIYKKSKKSISWIHAGKLPELAIQENNLPQIVEVGLGILSSRFNLGKAKVLIVINGYEFFLRSTEIPMIKGKNILPAVQWECAKQIPFPIEDAYFRILGIEKLKEKLRVFSAIINKLTVDQFDFLGDRLYGVIPSPIALGGNFLGTSDSSGDTEVIIHWTTTEAVVGFVGANGLVYSSSSRISDLTGQTARHGSIGIYEKIEHNISNSFDFYDSIYPDKGISSLKLYGARWEDTAKKIEQNTGIKASSAYTFYRFRNDEHKLKELWSGSGNSYILCAGAVLLEKDKLFLPDKVRDISRESKLKVKVEIATIISVIAVLLLSALFIFERMTKETILTDTIKDKSSLENSEGYKTAIEIREAINRNTSLLSKIRITPLQLNILLRAISHSVPENVSISLIDINRDGKDAGKFKMRIEGFFYGDIKKADIRLTKFMKSLDGYFITENSKIDRYGEKLDGENKYLGFAYSGTMRIPNE
ncbi:MAG: hypothetical protein GY855_13460 [candidate division Zixibacteria bacterium]|nr:hypothetical protein [candidate division Zixibacteria bacterium]